MKHPLALAFTVALVLALALTSASTFAASPSADLDPITRSRLEALMNTKRLVSREVVGTNIVYTYTQRGRTWTETNAVRHVDGTIQPTRYSKLKLYAILAQAGYWDPLKAWLESQTINGVNAWMAFTMAQDLRTDHPLFIHYFTAAKQVLGVDDATADAILAQCEE